VIEEKKKIIIIGPAHPYRGGLAVYNERLAKAFKEDGNEVSIETFTVQYPNFLFPGKTQFSDAPKPKDLQIDRTVNSVNPLNWWNVGRRVKALKPDYVIVRYWLPFMGPSLGTLSRIIRSNGVTKVLALIDNIIPHEKRIGDKQLSHYFTKSVDGFLVMSEDVERDLAQFNTKNLPIIRNPHPLFDNFGEQTTKEIASKTLGLPIEHDYILFFGFIRNYKGLDLLLEAFGDDYFKDSNKKLLIAGEFYNNSQQYFDIIKKYNLENQVFLHTEFISDDKVKYYFAMADLVALPYKSATQSGVTQIGFHFNKPMLVTNVGGLPEIIPHKKAGFVVEPKPQVIATAIKEFYEDDMQEELEKGLLEEKKKYDWQKLVNSFHKLASKIDKG
jgi:glycosyltransferase involved in cell wall biosynthesis